MLYCQRPSGGGIIGLERGVKREEMKNKDETRNERDKE